MPVASPLYFAHRQQAGLSLVELMVALLISSILTFGIIQIFSSNSQTSRLQEGLSRTQENTRFAMDVLQYDFRMAGFTGCSNNIFNWLDDNGTGYSSDLMSGVPVSGWEYSDTAPADTYTIDSLEPTGDTGSWSNGSGENVPGAISGNLLPGNDIVVINFADRMDVTLTGNPSPPANTINTDDASGIPQWTIIMAVTDNCAGGDLWQKTNSGDGATLPKGSGGDPGNINPSGGFTQEYNDDANIYSWVSMAYYIGQGSNGEPALFQRQLVAPAAPAQPELELVEGVESMQALYGIDSNGDRRVDEYTTADDVDDWNEVVGVRLSLLIRNSANNARDVGDNDTNTYNLIGTTIDPINDRRIRQMATTTIGLRNRLE